MADFVEGVLRVAADYDIAMVNRDGVVSGHTLYARNEARHTERKWAPAPEWSRGHRPATRRPGKTCRMMLSRECANDDG